MPVAPWQWLAAGTVAVAAHAAIGLALVGPPSPGGGGGSTSFSVPLTLGPGQSAGQARNAAVPERSTAKPSPAPAAAPPVQPPQDAAPAIQAKAVGPERDVPPAPEAPPHPPRRVEGAASTAVASRSVARRFNAEPARAARKAEAVASPPLPQARPQTAAPEAGGDRPQEPHSTAGIRLPDSGGGASQAMADPAEGNKNEARSALSGPGESNAAAERQSDDARAGYVAALQAWLQRHMQYPERAIARRQQGTATLYFVVDRLGRVLDYRLEQSSGHRLLDREALAMIERAAPMPQMPASLIASDMAVVVPIRFALR
jgi:protein TonB